MAVLASSVKFPSWTTDIFVVSGSIILTGAWFIAGAWFGYCIYIIHEWGMFWIFGPGMFGAPIFSVIPLILIYRLRAYSQSNGLRRP